MKKRIERIEGMARKRDCLGLLKEVFDEDTSARLINQGYG